MRRHIFGFTLCNSKEQGSSSPVNVSVMVVLKCLALSYISGEVCSHSETDFAILRRIFPIVPQNR